ncbi:MAG: hypothetical protein J6R40_04500 [Clostridia bacterium]|nr:hypothetical protein [Clostridia bacterium]
MKLNKKTSILVLILALVLVLAVGAVLAFTLLRDGGEDPTGKEPEATLEYVNYVLGIAPTKINSEVKTTVPEFDVTLTSTSTLQVRVDAAGKYSRYTYSTEVFAGLGSEEMTEVIKGTEYTRGNTFRNEEGKEVLYKDGVITFDAFALPANTVVTAVEGAEDTFTATVIFDSNASKSILGYAVAAQGNITLTMTVKGASLTTATLSYTTVNGASVVANCTYDYTAQSFK